MDTSILECKVLDIKALEGCHRDVEGYKLQYITNLIWYVGLFFMGTVGFGLNLVYDIYIYGWYMMAIHPTLRGVLLGCFPVMVILFYFDGVWNDDLTNITRNIMDYDGIYHLVVRIMLQLGWFLWLEFGRIYEISTPGGIFWPLELWWTGST